MYVRSSRLHCLLSLASVWNIPDVDSQEEANRNNSSSQAENVFLFQSSINVLQLSNHAGAWSQNLVIHVRAMSETALFVAVTGAHLTNLIFMPSDSVVMEIAAYTDWDYESNALHASIFYMRYRLRAEEIVRESHGY